MQLIRLRHEGLRRRDEDDAAVPLAQLLERGARGVERSQQIDVDDGLEAVRAQLFGRAEKVACGASDNHVDGPELGLRARDRAGQCSRVAHVGGDRQHLAFDMRVQLAQADCSVVELVLRAAANADVRAERCEVRCDAEVDAAAAAGHEDGLVLEQVARQMVLNDHEVLRVIKDRRRRARR